MMQRAHLPIRICRLMRAENQRTRRETKVARTRHRAAVRLAIASAALAAAAATPLAAAPLAATPRVHEIPRFDTLPRIDGAVDDAVWLDALQLELAFEVRPGENIPPPVRTVALLGYTADHLLVAFKAYDPDPASIRARLSDRDDIYDDDWVAIVLDTFNDQRRAYEFFANPIGVQGDQIEADSGGGEDWDAIWEAAGRITPAGYEVEMAIPFHCLGIQKSADAQTWGLDLVRSYPRSVRHHIGLFPRDRNNNCYFCQTDKLIGFAGASPGRNLEVIPTVASVMTQQYDDPTKRLESETGTSQDTQVGVTARWGFTPNMTLNATVNPDFSQVEADAAQLDINTQFALYYPEKRPFFLQGADFFSTRMDAVYTRTLADPMWGGKVTGKAGAHTIGAFTAADELTNLIFPSSQGSDSTSLELQTVASVFRYKRDLTGASTVGALVTDRQGGDYFNRLVSVDGDFRITPTDRVMVQVMGSMTRYPTEVVADFDQPEGSFGDHAVDAFYIHNTKTWDWYGHFIDIGPDFRADLGFMPQADYRFGDIGWGRTWERDPGGSWTLLNVGNGFEQSRDSAGNPLTRYVTCWFDYEGPWRSYLHAAAYLGDEWYEGERFNSSRVGFDGGFWPTGRWSVEVLGNIGDRIDYANVQQGSRVRLNPIIKLAVGRHLAVGLDHTWEILDVAAGRLYTANLSQLTARYQFTRRLGLRAVVQYASTTRDPELYVDAVDARSISLFTQLLGSYKINPQTVVFVGYSGNSANEWTDGLDRTDDTVFVKVGYSWRL